MKHRARRFGAIAKQQARERPSQQRKDLIAEHVFPRVLVVFAAGPEPPQVLVDELDTRARILNQLE